MRTTLKAFETTSSTDRVPRRSLLALTLFALALGYAVLQDGGLLLTDWNICLLLLSIAAFVYWTGSVPGSVEASKGPRLVPLFLGYIAFQWLPLPVGMLRILSPERARILDSLAPLTAVRFASLAVTPATTFLYLFRFIGYALVFLALRDMTRRWPAALRWLAVIPVAGLAVFEAGFGFWQSSVNQEVEGTYVNRNHFAGMLEMALPLTLAFGIALLQRQRASRRSPGARTFAAGALLISSGVILTGLLGSLSKMGFVAGLVALFSMAALAAATRVHGWKRGLAIAGIAALVLFLFVFLPSDELVARFGGLTAPGEPAEGRWPIWRDTLHLIAAYPLFGSGLGTYGVAFLKYQTSIVDRLFDFAHNDYLQLISELGGAGFLLLAALVLPVAASAIRCAMRGHDPDTRWLALGCAGSFAAIAVHSFADFNTYIPANALLLAWIGGICSGLPAESAPAAAQCDRRFAGRHLALLLAGLLAFYAPAWIVFQTLFRSDARAEAIFCRFGICDTDAVIAAETLGHAGNLAAIPEAELLRALRRDPNSPDRWCDTGESILRYGHRNQAAYCFARALALGPHIPPLLMRISDSYYKLNQTERALELRARALRETDTYDELIFDWYGSKKLPASVVLAQGLPDTPRAGRTYLRHLMTLDQSRDAGAAWNWNVTHGYVDERLAEDYTDFLMRREEYEVAAQAWARYLGSRRDGYLESNWVFNGDFEREVSGSPLDWHIDPREDVEVSRDDNMAHTGAHSLRITFAGRENLNYSSVSQTAVVKPGKYRFQAFVRTDRITTDEGVGFRIGDAAGSSGLNVMTERLTGTHDWTKLEQVFVVSPQTRLIRIVVVRRPSWKFDNKISGSFWIDTVKLAPEGGL